MRDYRDAKAMAHTVRVFLADHHGLKITNSQSLELIAKAFGVADWNTLAAVIRGEVSTSRTEAATPSATIDAGIRPRPPRFSSELERFPFDVNRNVIGDSLRLANQIRCLQRQHAGACDDEGILEGPQDACG
jgi:hypothetical protein